MACGCQHAMGAIGGVDGGECDKLFNFGVWPSDVDVLKQRLLLQVQALDSAVDAGTCASLSPQDRAAWDAFVFTGLGFLRTETDWLGAYNAWTNACSYSHTIDAWRAKLASKCGELPGPGPVAGADAALGSTKWISAAVMAVAVIAAVGGVVYVVRAVK